MTSKLLSESPFVLKTASATEQSDEEQEEEAARKPVFPKIVVDPVGEVFPFQLLLSIDSYAVLITLDDFNQVITRPIERDELDLDS